MSRASRNVMKSCARSWADVLIAFGAVFDSRMIKQSCMRYNLPQIVADWGCAMEMYRVHAGQRKRMSLANATLQCQVHNLQKYRARGDAEATLGVVQAVAGYGR